MSGKRRILLSLDGGGSRGLFALNILILLKHCLGIKLCDTFGLAVGSSVGAIVAALLAFGILDSDSNILDRVLALGRVMFKGKPLINGLFSPIYSGKEKHAGLKELFGTLTMKDTHLPICIITTNVDGRVRYICSWNPEDANILVADALCASAAAPIYFPPVRIGADFLVDGGVTNNNPIGATLLASLRMVPGDLHVKILSIGTHVAVDGTKAAPDDMSNMGIGQWFGGEHDLIGLIMGDGDTTEQQLAEALIGKDNVLRVSCDIKARLDMLDDSTVNALLCETVRVWHRDASALREFVAPESSSNTIDCLAYTDSLLSRVVAGADPHQCHSFADRIANAVPRS